ncbi:MAG: hypothetical protein PHQ34_04745 [Methanothrix sp.]|nr:hypothetical protein [Methanothrix sp.]
MAKFLIIFLTLLPALICSSQAVVWNEGMSGELHWGETMSLDRYSLVLDEFSVEEGHACKVLVQLQEDGHNVDRRPLQAGEYFEWNESVKVSVEKIVVGDIQDDPFAVIRLQLPAAPDLSLILTGDRETYEGGDEMRIQLQIENKGIVDAENMRIELTSIPPFVKEMYSISALGAGKIWDKKKDTQEIDNIKINIKAPYFSRATDLVLNAHAGYTDPDGKAYESWGGATFHIVGPILLHKSVDETQKFQEKYHVINSLRNTGNRTIALDLSDSTGSGFRAEVPLNWKFSLIPGEAKTIDYLIDAQQPGLGQVLPSSAVSYRWEENSYTIRSEEPVVNVFGPSIEAERSISPKKLQPGEIATVSILLTNLGNKGASVALPEAVPNETELVSGSVDALLFLPPNESCSKEYQLRCVGEGTICIPPEEICYRDARGNQYRTIMQALEIEVAEKERSDLNKSNLSQNNSTDAALNGTRDGWALYESEKSGAQTERDEAQMKKSGLEIGSEAEAEGSVKEYLPALLITIILLLSAAISKYL